MELLIDIIVIGVVLWFTFTWVVSFQLKKKIDEQLNEVMQDLDEERLIPLTVEVDQDQYFCYNSITKAFVCQGHTLKEIVERFKLRYPNKSAAIYNGDEKAVRILKQQMKELGENLSSVGRPS